MKVYLLDYCLINSIPFQLTVQKLQAFKKNRYTSNYNNRLYIEMNFKINKLLQKNSKCISKWRRDEVEIPKPLHQK